MLADGRSHGSDAHDRALRPPVRRRPVHRRQRRPSGLEILEDLPDVDAIVAPLGGGGLLAGIAAAVRELRAGHAASSPPNRKPPRRCAASLAAGRPVLLRRLDARRSSTAPAASRCSTTMWPLLRSLAGSIVVSLEDVARAMRLVAERAHVIAEGAAGCAVAAALDGGLRRGGRSRQGGRRRLGRQHRPRDSSPTLVGACPPMNRYSNLPPFPERDRPPRRPRRRPVVELASRSARGVPPPRLHALAGDGAQPGADAAADPAREARTGRGRRPGVPRSSTTRPSPRSTTRAARTTRGGRERFPQLTGQSIAYFSAEFALHQSLPIYAGGLGVLAGDHCKEASDLGVPLIGVGFMYPQGYFHQHVSAEGWQEESYERLELGRRADRAGARRRTASRASPPCRSAIARCWWRSGACGSAA